MGAEVGAEEGSPGGALPLQGDPIPLPDRGFDLKMFSEEGRPVHLAGSESAISSLRICIENLSQSCSLPGHVSIPVSVLSSYKVNYMDTRKALSNWWIIFPLFHLRLFVSCIVA